MEDPELERWAEERWGGTPDPELFALAAEVSHQIMAIVTDPDLYFRLTRLDLVRLVVQARLIDFLAEGIRLDRHTEPVFFGTKPQTLGFHQPREPKPEPPLRSWIRRRASSPAPPPS